jgi:hypothetical protein
MDTTDYETDRNSENSFERRLKIENAATGIVLSNYKLSKMNKGSNESDNGDDNRRGRRNRNSRRS